jgi:cytosine/adenosine deaminase-related metal-dependent hydrolase
MRQAGVSVVLGTDGRSTNPDLNILRDLQHVLNLNPDLSCPDVLGMVTTTAAAALGLPELSQPVAPGRPLRATMLHLPAGQDGLSAVFQHASAATRLDMPAHSADL